MISFNRIGDDRRELSAWKVDRCVDVIGSNSSLLRAKNTNRIELHNSGRKMDSSLSCLYDNKIGYAKAMVNSNIA